MRLGDKIDSMPTSRYAVVLAVMAGALIFGVGFNLGMVAQRWRERSSPAITTPRTPRTPGNPHTIAPRILIEPESRPLEQRKGC